MLFVLQCTDYKQHFLTLTLTLTLLLEKWQSMTLCYYSDMSTRRGVAVVTRSVGHVFRSIFLGHLQINASYAYPLTLWHGLNSFRIYIAGLVQTGTKLIYVHSNALIC